MTLAQSLPAWYETVRLHPDIEAGNFSRATFAVNFGALIANEPTVPLVYRDARAFWEATYLTGEMRRMLSDVLGGLAGSSGDRVLQLRSPFGGGKSHVLAALYHGARDRASLLSIIPAAGALADPGIAVRVAPIDGERFGPREGMDTAGLKVRTLWGALAAMLGCFDMVKDNEAGLTAPGGDLVRQLLGETPTLILLDEMLRYVERAYTIEARDSTLGKQTLDFLQTLTTEVANSTHAVMVYSLQASTKEAFENASLLGMLDHLTSRVDAKREPASGDEVLHVLRKRLLAQPPDPAETRRVAETIAQIVTNSKMAGAGNDQSRREAQDERVEFSNRLDIAYPFHVALIDLMKNRWASLPNFQVTRGSLRFIATVLRSIKSLDRRNIVVAPGHVPLEDPDVRNAFYGEVIADEELRKQYQPVLDNDFLGANSRVKRIDRRLAQESPALSSVQPAMQLATAILMYSFGGLRREAAGETLPPGITEAELMEACLLPGLDSITAQSVLKRLRDECLYLHYDGVRYCFKTLANVNKIIEDEADHVRLDEANDFIRRQIDGQVGSITNNAAVIWPASSDQIDDRRPRFIIAYLPLDFAEKSRQEQEKLALAYLTTYGKEPRRYRNGLAVAVPERKEIEGLRRAAKYLLAVERVNSKQTVYKLSKEQRDQVKEREATEKASLAAGLLALYPSAWLLDLRNNDLVLDKAEIGGRPIRANNMHERLVELLSEVTMKLFKTLRPQKLVSILNIGTEQGQMEGFETKRVRDDFFGNPGWVRLMDETVLADSVAQAVNLGLIAYCLKNKVKTVNEGQGSYSVDGRDTARTGVSAGEIDIDDGFILVRSRVVVPEEGPSGGPQPPPPVEPPVPVEGPGPVRPPGGAPGAKIRSVQIKMKLGKTAIYKTLQPLGNLADKAGEITVTVEAADLKDVDQTWLRNAVEEPLAEADIETDIWKEYE